MLATRVLRAQHRTPMIKFLGKRTPPKKIDHTPHVHPASPTSDLPNSFASYRQKAQQHGPLQGQQQPQRQQPSQMAASPPPQNGSGITSISPPPVHSRTGASLGDWHPANGQYLDRSELPARFRRTPFSAQEMEAIDSGGASLFG